MSESALIPLARSCIYALAPRPSGDTASEMAFIAARVSGFNRTGPAQLGIIEEARALLFREIVVRLSCRLYPRRKPIVVSGVVSQRG
jgi:hypothetical protein